ncbi:MAG: M48 family metalloprotease [Gammaproteobacteria bacterium]|nr:M48 family metalloprotease [Gammaproteobacteria bacterium]MBT8076443.1 M48 family metalloprotease [Gammaproteobacteria bacterium]
MNASGIRCDNDTKIAQNLLNHMLVQRVKEQVDREAEKGPMGMRRRLLSTSVRLSRSMSPTVHKMADHCIEKLGVDLPLELYAYASPQFNAACFKPEEGRLFVMFSSGLLEAFDENELMFVVGHEFGHHVYQHHDMPVGYILNGTQRPSANLALQLFAWTRYAEISADRAGAFCANDLEAVAKALFKLASGLTSNRIVSFNLSEFLHQLDEMQATDAEPGQGAPMEDWFSTHPFSPLRVKALQLFHQSGLMLPGGIDKAELELHVQGMLGMMEPDYLEGHTDVAKKMRLLFIAGAVAVANARAGISEREASVLKEFMGEEFSLETLNIDKLIDTLPKRIRAVKKHASLPQRMQVVRDLSVVARAEGQITDNELLVLYGIADGLAIRRSIVGHILNGDTELD